MHDYSYLIFSRAIHVVGVILWIGGVAFVTTTLIPALKNIEHSKNKLELFEQLEGRFAFQAKIVTFITAASGFFMLQSLNAWERYLHIEYWWLHLMTLVWVIFTLVLFVLEPLVLHKWFHDQATKNSEHAFLWLHRMHIILLTLSIIATIGAVLGSHGYAF